MILIFLLLAGVFLKTAKWMSMLVRVNRAVAARVKNARARAAQER